jgi:TatA/E family protein of Tat protein translocase
MASLSIWHWLIVFVVVILIFATKRFGFVGSDFGAATRNRRMSFPIWVHVAVASILLFCLLIAAKMLTAQ